MLTQKRINEVLKYEATYPTPQDIPYLPDLDARIWEAITTSNDTWFDMDTWESITPCGTNYCRAGYAVFVAGLLKTRLLMRVGWSDLASLLYLQAGKRIPDFYTTNGIARRSIERAAARDRAKYPKETTACLPNTNPS